MMGSLASPPPGILPVTAAAVGFGLLVLSPFGGALNALSLARRRRDISAWMSCGAHPAAARGFPRDGRGGLGERPRRFRRARGAHALRTLIGADHRLLVPASALAGATALVVADTVARSILPPRRSPWA